MPQLDPKPWLSTLVLSWFCLLTIIPVKLTGHIFIKPEPKAVPVQQSASYWGWSWPLVGSLP